MLVIIINSVWINNPQIIIKITSLKACCVCRQRTRFSNAQFFQLVPLTNAVTWSLTADNRIAVTLSSHSTERLASEGETVQYTAELAYLKIANVSKHSWCRNENIPFVKTEITERYRKVRRSSKHRKSLFCGSKKPVMNHGILTHESLKLY